MQTSFVPLTPQQLQHAAPAVFATEPDYDVSDRYQFVPTIEVVESMGRFGWYPVEARQKKVRLAGNIETTKHMVLFRNPDLPLIRITDRDPVALQIALTNSHDRTSRFKILAALLRFICENGLVVSDATFGSISVMHSNKAIDEIIANAFNMIGELPRIGQNIESFAHKELTPQQQYAYARSALHYKYEVHNQQNDGKPQQIVYRDVNKFRAEQHKATREGRDPATIHLLPISPDDLLNSRRHEDTGMRVRQGYREIGKAKNDLWTTYNVVQENLLKGGQRGMSESGRRSTTRAVTSIDGDLKLNRALWSMAEYLRDHAA